MEMIKAWSNDHRLQLTLRKFPLERWNSLRIPFADLLADSSGRPQEGDPLHSFTIRGIGKNKKAVRLYVDNVKIVRGQSSHDKGIERTSE